MTRIEDYGLIGDLQTAALVGPDGSIDWACFPRFDSGACFAALLGTAEHGRWLVAPRTDSWESGRRYRPRTLVLETEWETDSRAVRLIDFMPPRGKAPDIVRIVEGLHGEVDMSSELVIRFDYGSAMPWVRRIDGAVSAVAGPDALYLWTDVETHGRSLADRTTTWRFGENRCEAGGSRTLAAGTGQKPIAAAYIVRVGEENKQLVHSASPGGSARVHHSDRIARPGIDFSRARRRSPDRPPPGTP